MQGSVLPVELSLQADRDLEDIFDYTAEQFGLN
jgi:plasmid stabilization system protein ParE